jgi:radical SAM protein with 4Fe4S-binding SPASM domain
MPGSTGIALKATPASLNPSLPGTPTKPEARAGGHPGGHPGGGKHPDGLNAVTKGCLAGTGVCFISHQGEVFPCGYLPALAGDLRKQSFAEVWTKSQVFETLRDNNQLTGKCGCCEFRNVCMGCRARAYAATGDYMAAEPFCVYEPKTLPPQPAQPRRVSGTPD